MCLETSLNRKFLSLLPIVDRKYVQLWIEFGCISLRWFSAKSTECIQLKELKISLFLFKIKTSFLSTLVGFKFNFLKTWQQLEQINLLYRLYSLLRIGKENVTLVDLNILGFKNKYSADYFIDSWFYYLNVFLQNMLVFFKSTLIYMYEIGI